MLRRIALLLGFLSVFTLPALAQEQTPTQAKFKVKTIQWVDQNVDLVIVLETGEKYMLHLHPLFPFTEKESKEEEYRPLLFPYVYEAVLQQRFIAMLSHKINFSTARHDECQSQGEGKKKVILARRIDTFTWDIPGQNLSVEITPGAIVEGGDTIPLDEKLRYAFDLKNGKIFLEGSHSCQLEENDVEMIKDFLDFLAIYARENVEWYEVEMGRKLKTPTPPEKKEEKKKNSIASSFSASNFLPHGSFLPHPVF